MQVSLETKMGLRDCGLGFIHVFMYTYFCIHIFLGRFHLLIWLICWELLWVSRYIVVVAYSTGRFLQVSPVICGSFAGNHSCVGFEGLERWVSGTW